METLIYTPNLDNLAHLQNGTNPNSIFHLHSNLVNSLPCFKENLFQKIIISLPDLSELTQPALHNLYSILKAGGNLTISITSQQNWNILAFKDLYTIAGFKEEDSGDSVTIRLTKPAWAGKGVATLKKKTNGTNGAGVVKLDQGTSDVSVNNTVKIDAGEEKKANPFAKFAAQATDTKMIIEEDSLLKDEQGYESLAKDESCSTKPKACANCSCGRAELEAQGAAQEEISKKIEKGNVQSSCGNCYLGDAFRCGTCPYKGLPAFKPGDKVKLDLSKDGLGGVLKEDNDVVVSNGKVKLQI